MCIWIILINKQKALWHTAISRWNTDSHTITEIKQRQYLCEWPFGDTKFCKLEYASAGNE